MDMAMVIDPEMDKYTDTYKDMDMGIDMETDINIL